MATDLIYVGETGKKLRVRVFEDSSSEDLSSATNLELRLLKPGKENETILSGDPEAGGTPKFIEYQLVSGDLNIAGKYSLHAEFDDGGRHFIGDKETFTVYQKHTGPGPTNTGG